MRSFSLADKIILGFMMMIGMAEIGHLLMVFGNRPFSDALLLFCAGMVAGILVLLVWSMATKSKTGNKIKKADEPSVGRILLGFAFIMLCVYQILIICSGEWIYRTGDMTIETVKSILTTGDLYRVNPLTGAPYLIGVPKRIQLLGLPTLYAFGCSLLQQEPVEFVQRIVPICVLLVGYLADWTLAKALFAEKKDWQKRMLFMVLVAILICVNDRAIGAEGFGILYCGYRATTLRSMILLPYTFSLALRKKWKWTVICILAEACIMWTLYGMGLCLVVAFFMGAVRAFTNKTSFEVVTKKEVG